MTLKNRVRVSHVEFKKNVLSQVIDARNKDLSSVDYQNLPCRMSLTGFSPMSHVKFKK